MDAPPKTLTDALDRWGFGRPVWHPDAGECGQWHWHETGGDCHVIYEPSDRWPYYVCLLPAVVTPLRSDHLLAGDLGELLDALARVYG